MIIPDEKVQLALDWLNENAGPAAAARADRERAAYSVKRVRSLAFLDADGNNAEREAKALTSRDYAEAVEAECRAIERDEEFRNNRSKCEAIIEAWRTVQATARATSRLQ